MVLADADCYAAAAPLQDASAVAWPCGSLTIATAPVSSTPTPQKSRRINQRMHFICLCLAFTAEPTFLSNSLIPRGLTKTRSHILLESRYHECTKLQLKTPSIKAMDLCCRVGGLSKTQRIRPKSISIVPSLVGPRIQTMHGLGR